MTGVTIEVTGIETFVCRVHYANWVFVRAMTNSGLYGVGKSTLEMHDPTVAQATRELEYYVVARNAYGCRTRSDWSPQSPVLGAGEWGRSP